MIVVQKAAPNNGAAFFHKCKHKVTLEDDKSAQVLFKMQEMSDDVNFNLVLT